VVAGFGTESKDAELVEERLPAALDSAVAVSE